VQCYVVRVYRRNSDKKDVAAGIIEKVGTSHYSFLDLSELMNSLEYFIKSNDLDISDSREVVMCG
jgi:hypothetical protein